MVITIGTYILAIGAVASFLVALVAKPYKEYKAIKTYRGNPKLCEELWGLCDIFHNKHYMKNEYDSGNLKYFRPRDSKATLMHMGVYIREKEKALANGTLKEEDINNNYMSKLMIVHERPRVKYWEKNLTT